MYCLIFQAQLLAQNFSIFYRFCVCIVKNLNCWAPGPGPWSSIRDPWASCLSVRSPGAPVCQLGAPEFPVCRLGVPGSSGRWLGAPWLLVRGPGAPW